MKAIAGLGNPGKKYQGTRHNVGFAVIDELAARWRLREFDSKFNAEYEIWRPPDGDAVLLLKPLTYMNESGQALGDITRYYRVEVGDLLVVVDEVQLPLGRLRARARGSAGGHNGLKSVIAHLGGHDFSRLRLGVGRGDDRRDLADHVLARFEPQEHEEATRMIARAADAAQMFITSGIEAVMNTYNGGDPAVTE